MWGWGGVSVGVASFRTQRGWGRRQSTTLFQHSSPPRHPRHVPPRSLPCVARWRARGRGERRRRGGRETRGRDGREGKNDAAAPPSTRPRALNHPLHHPSHYCTRTSSCMMRPPMSAAPAAGGTPSTSMREVGGRERRKARGPRGVSARWGAEEDVCVHAGPGGGGGEARESGGRAERARAFTM